MKIAYSKSWLGFQLLCSFILFTTPVLSQQIISPNALLVAIPKPTKNVGEFQLIGTRWVLKHSKKINLLLGTIITLNFFDAKNLGGSDGCNFYGLEYTVYPENMFTVGEGSRHQVGCDIGEASQADTYSAFNS